MTWTSIAQFDAVTTRTADEAEFYYATVHLPMLRRLYTDHTDQVERYLTQKVLAKYDLAGDSTVRWTRGGSLSPAFSGCGIGRP